MNWKAEAFNEAVKGFICDIFSGLRHMPGCGDRCRCTKCQEATVKDNHTDTSQRRVVRRAAYE